MDQTRIIYAALYILEATHPNVATTAIEELDKLTEREAKLIDALKHAEKTLNTIQLSEFNNTLNRLEIARLARTEVATIRKLIGDNHET